MKKNFVKSLLLFVVILGALCSCNNNEIPTRVLKDKIDKEIDSKWYKPIFLPIGDVVFDELKPKNYGFIGVQKIFFENFMALQEEGLVTCELKEQVGRVYRMQVSLTDKGKEYLHGKESKQGSLHFIPVKAYTLERGNKLEVEYGYQHEMRGLCTYSQKYKDVTPFGRIWEGAKPGEDSPKHDGSFYLYRESKDGKWVTK